MPKFFKDIKPQSKDLPTELYDIIIVGAGIAGLYSAYRLQQNDPTLKIAIVERLNRTGGRLDSDLIPLDNDGNLVVGEGTPGNINTVKEEQGGMRFNYSMEELMTLIYDLNLQDQIIPFPMKSEVDGVNTNRFFVRDQAFSVAEAEANCNAMWSTLYDLEPNEQNRDPFDIITEAFNAVADANDQNTGQEFTPDEWTQVREEWEWEDATLNKWHIWGLLSNMGYSEECIRMLADVTGFPDTFKAFTNAGGAFQLLGDFPSNPVYYTFQDGFSVLPDAIVAALESDSNKKKVEIFLSTNLNNLNDTGSGFELRLAEAVFGENATPYSSETVPMYANKVILATAVQGIQDIFYKSPALYEHGDARELWSRINEVEGAELMKINLYFQNSWWIDGTTGNPDIQFGPNFTTLPLNSIYPFYALESLDVNGDTVTITEEDRPAALTLYTDFSKTQFWEGLQNVGPMFDSALQTYYSSQESQVIFPASQAVVDEMMKQLKLLFEVEQLPQPILTSYRSWDGKDDFEYSYHQWRLNAVDSETRAYLSKPYVDKDIYLCNEAISDMQAWVNGSLRSANLVLNHFNIAPLPPADILSEVLKAAPVKKAQGFGGLWR